MSILVRRDDSTIVDKKINVEDIVFGFHYKEKDGITGETPDDFIADLVAICIEEDDYCNRKEDMIYFNNPILKNAQDEEVMKYLSQAEILHNKDMNERDLQQIKVRLKKIPSRIKKIVFLVGIYNSSINGYKFTQVENVGVKITNEENYEELVRNDRYPKGFFNKETNIILGELSRTSDGFWEYTNLSSAYTGEISRVMMIYLKTKGD